MADTTGKDGIFDEPASEEADDFFSGGNRDAAPARRGESLDEILRDGAANDRRDESISNIHTGSKEDHVSVVMSPPPEGAPPPPTPIIEPDQYTPGDPPPPIDPIDVDQEAGGNYQTEERGLDFGFDEGQFREDRVFEDIRRPDEQEDVRREGDREEDGAEELILTPQTNNDDDDPTVPTEVDDNPEAPVVANSVLDEDDLSAGSDGTGPRSITKPLIIDFGDDGAGSVRLTIPESLKQVQAGPDGSTLNVELSPDGNSITALNTDGEPVFKVTLNSSGGSFSYTFELQGPVHHGEADQIDFPIGVAVTDSDGDLAVGEFKVGIVDDEPVARDDETVSVDEGAGNVIGSDNGADNLLANDEVGADGALIFQFTYTDENGEEQTARAGETVDTEHGTLTVNADGSWTFEADDQIDHDGNEVIADNFTYSIVDADGDTSSATQSIEITDDGPKIGFPPADDDPDGKGDLATLFEDDIAGGNASVTQTLEIDFGTDGEGSVALSIPQELEDMGLTADGKPVEFSLSEDGQSIIATAGGEPVFTMSLSEEGGEYSYTFELQGNLDHPDAGSDVLSNLPFDLTVTDGDGSTATAEININVVDDQPEAVGETTLKMEEGGGTVGSGNGGQNLLANDDLGADGGEITSFTYADEDGNQQTAQAGDTVDTENGTLTVNSDGSWSFTADESADHSDGKVLDGFTYTLTDGDGDTSQATQRIEITDTGPEIPPNDPPTGTPLGEGDQPDLGRADLIVDEDNMGSATQAIEVDFGSDGFGSASLSVPQELQDMNLTSGGEAISYTVSDDGQSITASTPDGSPVFTVTLDANPETGEMSYTVDLQGNVDHAETGAGDDLLSNIPVTLTVTDGDGTEASTNLEIGIKDDNPEAADDAAVTLEEGGNTVGSGNGGDNLLANDDVGADGGQITSFTYTDEDGNQQTADAGQTVDTEHGTLTVNSDGSWSFESDPNSDHSDGAVSDGFTYTITDGDGDTATASQSITVTDTGPEIPPNDPPTGTPPGEGDQPDLGRADLIVDEDNMGSATQAIEVDFGSDGFGSASLSVPQELQDMNLTSGGEA
ncbi:MAG: cadherin-like domain-containing protein, partial [Rhodospirillales bacterium]|nr:cadherin-like domain-containing protein [Rhodospirillales bacterium]